MEIIAADFTMHLGKRLQALEAYYLVFPIYASFAAKAILHRLGR